MTDLKTLPDRELDAWLAEHAMGWTPNAVHPNLRGAGWFQEPDGSFTCDLPEFSVSPDRSKALRDRMRELGWKSCLFSTDVFTMRFWGYKRGQDTVEAHADTEERAVAEAAALAMGYGKEGER